MLKSVIQRSAATCHKTLVTGTFHGNLKQVRESMIQGEALPTFLGSKVLEFKLWAFWGVFFAIFYYLRTGSFSSPEPKAHKINLKDGHALAFVVRNFKNL